MILVDTNVFSELVKVEPAPAVVDWLFVHRHETLLSSIVVAEIAIGVETTSGPEKRRLLIGWLDRLIERHGDRLVLFNVAAARRWATIGATALIGDQRIGSRQFDTLLAAQALALGVPIATRNGRDFEDMGLEIIDPWILS